MQTLLPLSIVINTKNSQETLSKALSSVSDFANQIIVMDMKSVDNSIQIAKKFTRDVYETTQDFDYVEPARNQALSKATQPWILILDADEEVSEGLKTEIKKVVIEAENHFDAYFIPRQNQIFQREMTGTGWWPDYQLRLFKKGVVSWSNQIHSTPKIKGNVGYLPNRIENSIFHHNFQNLNQFIERLNRYTSIEATSKSQQATFSSSQAFREFNNEFLRRLFKEKGIDEGLHGMSLSLLQSMYQLTTYLKKWEISNFPTKSMGQESTVKELRSFQKDLNYWIANWQIEQTTGLVKFRWKIRRKLKI